MENGWQQFLSLCLKTTNEKELSHLLNFFLTFDERENIVNRVLITKELLDSKLPQREISDKLKVSIAKITRGSNALKTIDEPLKNFLQEHFNK